MYKRYIPNRIRPRIKYPASDSKAGGILIGDFFIKYSTLNKNYRITLIMEEIWLFYLYKSIVPYDVATLSSYPHANSGVQWFCYHLSHL